MIVDPVREHPPCKAREKPANPLRARVIPALRGPAGRLAVWQLTAEKAA